VAEVDTGFEQLPHRNGRHEKRPPVGLGPPRTSSPGFRAAFRAFRRLARPAPSRSERSACDLRRRRRQPSRRGWVRAPGPSGARRSV